MAFFCICPKGVASTQKLLEILQTLEGYVAMWALLIPSKAKNVKDEEFVAPTSSEIRSTMVARGFQGKKLLCPLGSLVFLGLRLPLGSHSLVLPWVPLLGSLDALDFQFLVSLMFFTHLGFTRPLGLPGFCWFPLFPDLL